MKGSIQKEMHSGAFAERDETFAVADSPRRHASILLGWPAFVKKKAGARTIRGFLSSIN
jgi:hypothetical protein